MWQWLISAAPPPPPPPPPPPAYDRSPSPYDRSGPTPPKSKRKSGESQKSSWLGSAVTAAVAMGAFGAFALSRYRRCAPNQVLVIFGKTGGKPSGGAAAWEGRVQHGGGAFVWPVIQDYAYLSLEPLAIDIDLKGALSHEKIRLNIPTVVTVAIGETGEIQRAAAMRLLGMDRAAVVNQVEEIVIGQLRQVVASLSIEQINQDRESFVIAVAEHCGEELNKIGIDLINMNVQNIKDDAGVIDALGKRAAAEAVQQARIDVADRERHGQIGVTMAEKEKEIAVEQAEKERTIGVTEQQREKDVRVAQAQRDRDIGMREAQQESEVRRADLLAIETAGVNEASARVAASRAQLMVAEAESFKMGETSRALAEAAVQEAQATAQAQAALAEAKKIEAEKRAELEAPAKAAHAELVVQAEARAAEARILAAGEADAIYAKLDAEARGQYQILSRKAAGLEAIVAGVGGSQQAFQLMMLEHVDTLAETSAKAISNIKFDKVTVWDTGSGGGGGAGGADGSSTSNFIRGLATSMPPTLDMLKDVTGVDLPGMMQQQQQQMQQQQMQQLEDAQGATRAEGDAAAEEDAVEKKGTQSAEKKE